LGGQVATSSNYPYYYQHYARSQDWLAATLVIPRQLFSIDHDLFRSSVRRFIQEEILPYHADWERDGVVPRELWQLAGSKGLLCCDVPTEYGGLGAGFLYSVIVAEEMAASGASGPYFHLHSDIVAPYLVHYGTDEQKATWLPKMARGEAIGALAMSEPSGGSDVQGIQTVARRVGDEYVLHGQKVFISNGQLADLVIVAAQTNPGSRAKGLTLFLVEGDRPGFSRGRPLDKIGLKAQDNCELFFDDVHIPATNVLGEVGGGFRQLMQELKQERLLQALRSVAVAEAAIRWTVDYVTQRQVFGKSLATYQNTQFQMAENLAATLAQRVLVDRCIELHLVNQLADVDAAIVKLNAVELHCKVVDECLQLFGGWGYMWEYPIARAYADARQTKLSGGSVEVMKVIISRWLFGPDVAKIRTRTGAVQPVARAEAEGA
jgi:alkylation response protein AidB-like acyl-CoA dehydrogenase